MIYSTNHLICKKNPKIQFYVPNQHSSQETTRKIDCQEFLLLWLIYGEAKLGQRQTPTTSPRGHGRDKSSIHSEQSHFFLLLLLLLLKKKAAVQLFFFFLDTIRLPQHLKVDLLQCRKHLCFTFSKSRPLNPLTKLLTHVPQANTADSRRSTIIFPDSD